MRKHIARRLKRAIASSSAVKTHVVLFTFPSDFNCCGVVMLLQWLGFKLSVYRASGLVHILAAFFFSWFLDQIILTVCMCIVFRYFLLKPFRFSRPWELLVGRLWWSWNSRQKCCGFHAQAIRNSLQKHSNFKLQKVCRRKWSGCLRSHSS